MGMRKEAVQDERNFGKGSVGGAPASSASPNQFLGASLGDDGQNFMSNPTPQGSGAQNLPNLGQGRNYQDRMSPDGIPSPGSVMPATSMPNTSGNLPTFGGMREMNSSPIGQHSNQSGSGTIRSTHHSGQSDQDNSGLTSPTDQVVSQSNLDRSSEMKEFMLNSNEITMKALLDIPTFILNTSLLELSESSEDDKLHQGIHTVEYFSNPTNQPTEVANFIESLKLPDLNPKKMGDSFPGGSFGTNGSSSAAESTANSNNMSAASMSPEVRRMDNMTSPSNSARESLGFISNIQRSTIKANLELQFQCYREFGKGDF